MENNNNKINPEANSFTINVKNGKAVSSRPLSEPRKSSVQELIAMLDDTQIEAKPKKTATKTEVKAEKIAQKTAPQPKPQAQPRPRTQIKENSDTTPKTLDALLFDTEEAPQEEKAEPIAKTLTAPTEEEKTEFQKLTSFGEKRKPIKKRPPVGQKVVITDESLPKQENPASNTETAEPNDIEKEIDKVLSEKNSEAKIDPSKLTREERSALRKQRALQKSNKAICKNTAAIFVAVIILVNVINLITPDKDKSENESRSLQTFPTLSISKILDGSFGSELEDYITDQFFMRDNWISLKLFDDKALGKKEVNNVILGKDGYLMEDPDEVDYAKVDKNLDAINNFAQNNSGLKINMAIIPNNVTTMTDYLPDNIPVRDQAEDLNYLKNHLDASVNFIDTTATLKAHQDDYIYYRTDHHWTSLGAYYAFMDMASDLGISNPVTSYNIYTVTDSFEGTMASKSGSHSKKYRDSIEVYSPAGTTSDYYVLYNDTYEKSGSLYQSDKLSDKDKYTVFLGGNHPQVTINTTADTGKVLLLIKDSYANSFVQFLTPYYDEIVMIDPRYYYESVSTLIDSEAVTDVLFLYNCNTYMGDTSLCNVLG